MNQLLAGSMQQEVRSQTVGRRIQAVLSQNKLELAMPFFSASAWSKYNNCASTNTIYINNWHEIGSYHDKVCLKFEIWIILFCFMTESVSWCMMRFFSNKQKKYPLKHLTMQTDMTCGQNASSDISLLCVSELLFFVSFKLSWLGLRVCRNNQLICQSIDHLQRLCLTVFKCCFHTRSSPAYAFYPECIWKDIYW